MESGDFHFSVAACVTLGGMTLCLMPSEIFILSKIEYFKEQQV
jgi:hypothetical protein